MAKLDEIVHDPNYDAAATSASKATIFVFILNPSNLGGSDRS
jgi:hypothetical protein